MVKNDSRPTPQDLAGLRAVVTGGSRGIGAGIVARLLHGGATALERLRGVDLLVNNAGAARSFPSGSLTIPDAEWQDALDLNYLSAVRPPRCCTTARPRPR